MHVYTTDLDADGYVRFLAPSTKVDGRTGLAPSGFDGATIHYSVELPCIVIRENEPNVLLKSIADVENYMLEHGRSTSGALAGSATWTGE